MESTASSGPGRGYWIISILALVWNAIGIATYLMTVTMSPEAKAALPEAERQLMENTPSWAIGAYAIAVFAGTLGCIGLLVRRVWAVPVLLVSLLAILIQMGHALLATPLLEVRGTGGAVLPALIVVIAAYLVAFANRAKKMGWLR